MVFAQCRYENTILIFILVSMVTHCLEEECWGQQIKTYGILDPWRINLPYLCIQITISFKVEALPGSLGNRGARAFISMEQGNKGPNMKGTGEQMLFGGTGYIENLNFDFEEQGNKAVYFRGPREQVASGKASMFTFIWNSGVPPCNRVLVLLFCWEKLPSSHFPTFWYYIYSMFLNVFFLPCYPVINTLSTLCFAPLLPCNKYP